MIRSISLKNSNWPTSVIIIAFAGVFFAALFVYYVDPFTPGLLPQCLVHKYTGLHCPGCGSLRATHLLLHGNLIGAISCNAFLILFIYPFSAYFLLSYINEKRFPMPRITSRMILIFSILLALFTILRNIPIVPFTILAP